MQNLEVKSESLEEMFYRYGFTSSVSGSIYDLINISNTIQSIRSPDSLDPRYLMEDVGYGLEPMACIANRFDTCVPLIESFVNIACILNNVDHWTKGLTLQKLGIAETDVKRFKEYLYTGSY